MGFLSAILNPKNAIFYLSLFAVIVDKNTPHGIQALYGLWIMDVLRSALLGYPDRVDNWKRERQTLLEQLYILDGKRLRGQSPDDALEKAMRHRKIVEWLRSAGMEVRRLVSVCTGAFLLAEAGLLDGRQVTTHWMDLERLQREYPRVAVESDAIYVREGRIWLTRPGDPRDYLLARGDRFPLVGDGTYVLEALADTTIALEGIPVKAALASITNKPDAHSNLTCGGVVSAHRSIFRDIQSQRKE